MDEAQIVDALYQAFIESQPRMEPAFSPKEIDYIIEPFAPGAFRDRVLKALSEARCPAQPAKPNVDVYEAAKERR